MDKSLYLILPAHNESGNIFPIYEEICNALTDTNYDFHILFVNDGSTDDTLEKIKSLANNDTRVRYISLSRNFGHQNAIKAGLDHADTSIVIMMDCDLQHPPHLINEMLACYEQGYDIVRTKRKEQQHEGYLKRKLSKQFYRLLSSISDIHVEEGSADFRLVSGKALEQLRMFDEFDLFHRGIIKWIGFKQISIEYTPSPRRFGETKYTFQRMVSFGLKGFTSFSTRPLYFAAYAGVFFACLSILYIPYILYSMYHGHVVEGWTSVLASIVFFGGLNLMILGLIGVYLSKVFLQIKNRPHYIVKETNI
ncbi:MAG: hypothetical protein RIR90_459 [Bacteroidota bacterium]|jgi:dolichol-phosphate mannosyltransferase